METLRLLQQHLPPVVLEFLRLGIWLFLIVVLFVPLERMFARSRQKIFRREFFTDLGYFFLSGVLPARLLVFPMAAVAWALHQGLPAAVHQWSAELSMGQRLAAAMIVGEFGTYWGHRWCHEIPLLWRFHAIHHSAREIDWLVNTRAHPVDLVFTRFCGLLPMYALGMAGSGGHGADLVPVVVVLFGTVWGFFIHANLRWRFGWLEWLISTPAFHHWHHTNDGAAVINKNFAPMMPWLDKLFGTFYLPRDRFPVRCGIDGPMAAGLAGQLLQPFRQHRALDR